MFNDINVAQYGLEGLTRKVLGWLCNLVENRPCGRRRSYDGEEGRQERCLHSRLSMATELSSEPGTASKRSVSSLWPTKSSRLSSESPNASTSPFFLCRPDS